MKILILFAFLVAYSLCDNWAVLVAGSNGYWNYRHQSDVCHAFHILNKNGIPESNIIVMMYDDIANDAQNPKKGSMINEPGGPNVYPGVPKDYVKNEVTPANFLKILRGEYMGPNKKTIKSDKNSNIFVFYSDHGSTGIVAFPDGSVLHAKDLIDTLKYMHMNNKYNKFVFYLEACESGSMFNNLLPNSWNIYATTASNPYVSSYACYYDSYYKAYLDDCYSIYWMNDTEYSDIWTRTLEQQYVNVKKRTTQSPVCKYGDVSWTNDVLGEFHGEKASNKKVNIARHTTKNAIDSRYVQIDYLQRLVADTKDQNKRETFIRQLEQLEQENNKLDVAWESFAGMLKLNPKNDADHCYSQTSIKVDCLKDAVMAAERQFGKFTEWSLYYARYLNDACDKNYKLEDIEGALNKIRLAMNF